MYNYMNAAYLAKLTYEISLLSIIQKSLTMRMRSRATLRERFQRSKKCCYLL